MTGQKGFTLLELMISIMMFAMISTAAYKLFESVSRAQQVTDGILDRLDVLQRAQLIMEKDLFQLVGRSIRDEFGDRKPAVQAPAGEGELIAFTRSGWRNPLNEIRSDLQRVQYEVDEGKLIRSYWKMLDRAPDPIQIRQVLLEQVQRVRLRFMDEKKSWRSTWPPEKTEAPNQALTQAQGQAKTASAAGKEDNSSMLPVAVELTVQHQDFGTMTTILPVSDFKPSDIKALSDGQQKKNQPADSKQQRQPPKGREQDRPEGGPNNEP
ncbi:type II secretion system protein GspJ [Endozoicomonas sp. OPT23]|uniref:type II secretion system minor pseudopilin GspJ n=1 Tax=Endozoicomonas sp. OPT23 TaxID=2072845 RepID=UPI00129B4708|nr:type II secretion system minor pseudopilin GspJ [Endozoicomonas sp. OPT23]MRI34626.1 type II secretion system protein GspJ [Endozoicomonas sp. OPT23]